MDLEFFAGAEQFQVFRFMYQDGRPFIERCVLNCTGHSREQVFEPLQDVCFFGKYIFPANLISWYEDPSVIWIRIWQVHFAPVSIFIMWVLCQFIFKDSQPVCVCGHDFMPSEIQVPEYLPVCAGGCVFGVSCKRCQLLQYRLSVHNISPSCNKVSRSRQPGAEGRVPRVWAGP